MIKNPQQILTLVKLELGNTNKFGKQLQKLSAEINSALICYPAGVTVGFRGGSFLAKHIHPIEVHNKQKKNLIIEYWGEKKKLLTWWKGYKL